MGVLRVVLEVLHFLSPPTFYKDLDKHVFLEKNLKDWEKENSCLKHSLRRSLRRKKKKPQSEKKKPQSEKLAHARKSTS